MTGLLREKLAHYFRCSLTMISPKLNTRVLYRVKFRRKLDLKSPKTLDEKILYLKLRDYEINPLVRQCADKYAVREYVNKCGLSEILNDLIAVYDRVEDINWERLPNQFAMKWNFGCGYNILCSDKTSLDIQMVSNQMKRWGKSKYHLGYSEMQYKGVPKKIIVEKYLSSGEGKLPEDYKVYCFNGKAKYVMVCIGREKGHPKFYYYNRAWNLQMLSQDAKDSGGNVNIAKPQNLDLLFQIAEKLSEPFEFVRCDFYILDDKIYFGELTFTPGGGMDTARLPEAQYHFGDLLHL